MPLSLNRPPLNDHLLHINKNTGVHKYHNKSFNCSLSLHRSCLPPIIKRARVDSPWHMLISCNDYYHIYYTLSLPSTKPKIPLNLLHYIDTNLTRTLGYLVDMLVLILFTVYRASADNFANGSQPTGFLSQSPTRLYISRN